ncbi:helix-hairpin-helix domain-containing protein [Haloferula sp. BvORR071]|uniref:helix-hairpin-helix domain-containing protein n=1 Tax=Haloferula sp. BvORR071 TaxID=1396141 RepID=UPI002240F7D9|nr:helix-hairpin-helix domain-containing protein [Haloferula sp. BvORR071]
MSSDLESLPNIGKSIAADLRSIGINSRRELQRKRPIQVYHQLEATMGQRHDPCVFYTLLAAKHFLKTEERLPWWKFTAEGKAALEAEGRNVKRAR